MEAILFSFVVASLFTLIFLVMSWGLAKIINRGPIIDFDAEKTKVKECLIWLRDRDNLKKIIVALFGLLLWIIGVTLSSLWGMVLITPYCKQSKVLFLLSMPIIYIILVPSMYYIFKKSLGVKLALFTVLFFILSVACTFMAVKYVDIYGFH